MHENRILPAIHLFNSDKLGTGKNHQHCNLIPFSHHLGFKVYNSIFKSDDVLSVSYLYNNYHDNEIKISYALEKNGEWRFYLAHLLADYLLSESDDYKGLVITREFEYDKNTHDLALNILNDYEIIHDDWIEKIEQLSTKQKKLKRRSNNDVI